MSDGSRAANVSDPRDSADVVVDLPLLRGQIGDFTAVPVPHAWSTATSSEVLENVRSAMKRMHERAYEPPPPFVLSPRAHDHANELLDRPAGTPLSRADFYRAIEIELERMTPEQRDATMALLLSAGHW